MVRCFEDDDIVHVAGKVDPLADIEVINTELALADLETVEQRPAARREGVQGRRQGRRSALRDLLKRVREHLDAGKPVRTLALDAAERPLLRELLPDHGQAADVRRQRRRERLHEQPATSSTVEKRAVGRGRRRWCRCAPRSRPRSRSSSRRAAWRSSRRLGLRRAGPRTA
ncbi:MAG: hypothetical protein MZV65_52435 [Chromatiales bacterium]|nr:hypothetical protein [Chromatiales bacterium]